MKSTCVSTSQRIRPAIGSLLLTARLEPRAEQVDATLECGTVSLAVQLGRNECEHHPAQLVVELPAILFREPCAAPRIGEGGIEGERVRARRLAADMRHGPTMGEVHTPRMSREHGDS